MRCRAEMSESGWLRYRGLRIGNILSEWTDRMHRVCCRVSYPGLLSVHIIKCTECAAGWVIRDCWVYILSNAQRSDVWLLGVYIQWVYGWIMWDYWVFILPNTWENDMRLPGVFTIINAWTSDLWLLGVHTQTLWVIGMSNMILVGIYI